MTSTSDLSPHRRPALLVALLLCVSLASTGCGRMESELYGTISAAYPLEFDRVRAYSLGSELIIVYEKDYDPPSYSSTLGHPIRNQVVRLRFRSDLPDLVENQQVEFAAQGNDPPLGIVSRHVVSADTSGALVQEEDFPALRDGTVLFDALGDASGKPVVGTFDCTFSNSWTLRGHFDALLTDP